jgi:hypothetical protein
MHPAPGHLAPGHRLKVPVDIGHVELAQHRQDVGARLARLAGRRADHAHVDGEQLGARILAQQAQHRPPHRVADQLLAVPGVHHRLVGQPILVELDRDSPGLAQALPGLAQGRGGPLEGLVHFLVGRAVIAVDCADGGNTHHLVLAALIDPLQDAVADDADDDHCQ